MKNEISSIFLVLTESCNMGCTYCFEKNKNNSFMKQEEVYSSIKLLFESALENINVTLFGGEPTLNKPMIEYSISTIIDFLKTNKKNVRISMITNGYMFDENMFNDTFKRIHEYNTLNNKNEIEFSVQFSFHFDKESQDLKRRQKNGLSSYDEIFKNLNSTTLMLSDLYGSENIYKYVNIHPAIDEDDVGSIYSMMKNTVDYKKASFWIVPITEEIEWKDESLTHMYTQIKKGLEYCKTLYDSGDKNVFNRISNIATATREDIFRYKRNAPCGATKGLISVYPNGDVWQCHRLKESNSKSNLIGKISDEDIIEKNISFDFDKNVLMNSDGDICSNCEISEICYICPGINAQTTGELNITNSIQCKTQKVFWKAFTDFIAENEHIFKIEDLKENIKKEQEHNNMSLNINQIVLESLENSQNTINELIERYNYLVDYVEFLNKKIDNKKIRKRFYKK